MSIPNRIPPMKKNLPPKSLKEQLAPIASTEPVVEDTIKDTIVEDAESDDGVLNPDDPAVVRIASTMSIRSPKREDTGHTESSQSQQQRYLLNIVSKLDSGLDLLGYVTMGKDEKTLINLLLRIVDDLEDFANRM